MLPDALEQRLLDHLDGLQGAELDAFRERLRQLTKFLQGYAEAGAKACFLDDAKRKVEGLFQSLAAPARLSPRAETTDASDPGPRLLAITTPAAGARRGCAPSLAEPRPAPMIPTGWGGSRSPVVFGSEEGSSLQGSEYRRQRSET